MRDPADDAAGLAFPGEGGASLLRGSASVMMTGKDASLVGRGEELSRLRELVIPPCEESRVLLILGDPGMGKTVLLAAAAREAKLAGMRVLEAAGRESEQDLAFAGLAATVAHQTGLPEACAKARAALDALDCLGEPVPSAEDWPVSSADENRIWITACTDPFGGRAETVPYLHRIASGSLCDRGKVGGAAWILDETELAVRVLREALSQLRAPGVRGASGAVLSVLEWACIDSGRWDDALAAAREANDIAAALQFRREPGRSRRGHVAVRAGPASAGLRGVAETAAADQRRQARPRGGPGNVPPRAAPWTRRAEAELRACGVAAQTPPGAPGGLDGLTAQQREIVILAGRGLSNGEIADRLFLSPRTVASHLYRSYPKLGIAGRYQLRDLIDQSSTMQISG